MLKVPQYAHFRFFILDLGWNTETITSVSESFNIRQKYLHNFSKQSRKSSLQPASSIEITISRTRSEWRWLTTQHHLAAPAEVKTIHCLLKDWGLTRLECSLVQALLPGRHFTIVLTGVPARRKTRHSFIHFCWWGKPLPEAVPPT